MKTSSSCLLFVLILMTFMKMEKSNIFYKAMKVVLGAASPLWSWRVGIEWNARVCMVICSPTHPHAHMLTHYLPSSTLPQAPLTSPFDDVVKGAWPHALTRRWQHNGFKADVQEQWLQTTSDLHTSHTHLNMWFTGTLHRRNGLYTVHSIPLH